MTDIRSHPECYALWMQEIRRRERDACEKDTEIKRLQDLTDITDREIARQKAHSELVAGSARAACARRDQLQAACEAKDKEIARLIVDLTNTSTERDRLVEAVKALREQIDPLLRYEAIVDAKRAEKP